MFSFKRAAAAIVMAAPGLALLWFYVRRLRILRQAPVLSPGTPAETWIAVLVMGVACAALLMAYAVLRGRLNATFTAFGFMSLCAVTLVMSFAFVRVPGV